MYKIVWKDKAEESLSKIDKKLSQKIFNKVEKYLSQDPHGRGKPLTGEYRGFYRYRFSDYRVIYEIRDLELIVLVIKAGHRREIY